ncbi:MAG: cell division protein FtsQ/DivIB [Actinomycetes bacterium]
MSAGASRLRHRSARSAAEGAGSVGSADAFARRRRRLRRRRLLVLSVPVVLLMLAATAVWALLASPLLAVTTVEVSGTHRATPSLIRLTADVPEGQPLARVDLAAVQRRVQSLPVVASATIIRRWPHTVLVAVVERTPAAVARTAEGTWRLLDPSGVDLGGTPEPPHGLPVLDLDPTTAEPATLRAAAAVAASLPPSLRAKVATVVAASPDAVGLRLVNGRLVRWGSAEDGALKAQVLAVLMHRRARVYDVSAPRAPTTLS